MKFIKDLTIGDIRVSMFVAELCDAQTPTPYEILISSKGTRIPECTQHLTSRVEAEAVYYGMQAVMKVANIKG